MVSARERGFEGVSRDTTRVTKVLILVVTVILKWISPDLTDREGGGEGGVGEVPLVRLFLLLDLKEPVKSNFLGTGVFLVFMVSFSRVPVKFDFTGLLSTII